VEPALCKVLQNFTLPDGLEANGFQPTIRFSRKLKRRQSNAEEQ
jgi:hypothetical protein